MTRPIPAAHLQAIFSPRRDTPRAAPSPVTGNKTGTYPFREWLDVQPPVDPIELLRESVNRKAEEDREFNKDLAIIGWGLAFAYAWVCLFRLAQIGGVL